MKASFGIPLLLALGVLAAPLPGHGNPLNTRSKPGMSAYEKLIATVKPNVVRVRAGHMEDGKPNLNESLATGFFVSPNQVMTCLHVIGANPLFGVQIGADFTAVLSEKGSAIRRYPDLDLCVMTFKGEDFGVKGLPIAAHDPEDGAEVFTVGFPKKLAVHTSTRGYIAANNNRNKIEDAPGLKHEMLLDLTANDGNSGGPVINMKGEVVGVYKGMVSSRDKFFDSILREPPGQLGLSEANIAALDRIVSIMNCGLGIAIPSDYVRQVRDQVQGK